MNDTTPEVWIGARVLVEDAWEDEAGSLHDAFATVIAVDDDEVRLRFEETVIRKFYGDEAKGAQFSLDQLTRVDDTTPAVNVTCEATCNVPSHVETYGHGGHHCHLKKGHESTPGYEMHDPKIGTCKWPAAPSAAPVEREPEQPESKFVNISIRCHACCGEDQRYYGDATRGVQAVIEKFIREHTNCCSAFLKSEEVRRNGKTE